MKDGRLIYHFGKSTDGDSSMSKILGNKGANLAQICKLGIPAPPGFTISSNLCKRYLDDNESMKLIERDIISSLTILEKETGKKFGCSKNPLLLAVRSGSFISMPGMMDTVLNVGMNDDILHALCRNTQDHYFAYDSYRRFLSMYGEVVLGISSNLFDNIFGKYSDTNPDKIWTLKMVIERFKELILREVNSEFEDDPYSQLLSTIKAVFKSWKSEKANYYRKIHKIDSNVGTAVNVQAMVFGNYGNDSCTGVVFSRSPSDGQKNIFGEFLVNAQGEDIVSGTKTPNSIKSLGSGDSMEEKMPSIYNELTNICSILERHFKDMQDVEFTVEGGELYILQTRTGKRTGRASVKIAVDMANEGLISRDEALLMMEPKMMSDFLHDSIDYKSNPQIIARGLPSSPGVVSGIAVFSSEKAKLLSKKQRVILVKNDTSPDDIESMNYSSGILTARGGMTSHAAVVTRGMGKVCICGSNITIDDKLNLFKAGDILVKEGDHITIDGTTGYVIIGDVKLVRAELSKEFHTILKWADSRRKLKIFTNTDTIRDAKIAIEFGAEGVGLCRTEHMFFTKDKILLMQEMIFAKDKRDVIERLKPIHKNDLKSLMKIWNNMSINIRLLDPPLHEFLPKEEHEKILLAKELNITPDELEKSIESLYEINPMIGHRGCRIGISYPEIYSMQIEAICIAASELYLDNKIKSKIGIMIPFVSEVKEVILIRELINKVTKTIQERYQLELDIEVGAMIELPRAIMIADEIAKNVDYFSFGSNDLTQTSFAISRDDSSSFLPFYLDSGILKNDPFVTLDKSVAEFIKIGARKGRAINPNLKLSVCGEHAGDPDSISLIEEMNMNYISCSPYRIPVAKIAAAKSTILSKNDNRIERES